MKTVRTWPEFTAEAKKRGLTVLVGPGGWAEAVNEDLPGGFWYDPYRTGEMIGDFCDTPEEVEYCLPRYK